MDDQVSRKSGKPPRAVGVHGGGGPHPAEVAVPIPVSEESSWTHTSRMNSGPAVDDQRQHVGRTIATEWKANCRRGSPLSDVARDLSRGADRIASAANWRERQAGLAPLSKQPTPGCLAFRRRTDPPGWVGTGPCRRSRRRSNHRPVVSALRHMPGTNSESGRLRWA